MTNTAAGAEFGRGGAGNPGYDLEVMVTTVSDPRFGKKVTVAAADPYDPPNVGTDINF
jgi:hypothetical protein